MYINIDIPPELLEKIEERGRLQGLRRPAIVRYALARFVALEYPIADVKFVCPDCSMGVHCGGTASAITMDPKPATYGNEKRLRWVCVCSECSSEVAAGVAGTE